MTVVLFLAEFKLLLQNESIRRSWLRGAQPPDTSQAPPHSRGARSSTHGCVRGRGPAAALCWSWFIYSGCHHLQLIHPAAHGSACQGVLPGGTDGHRAGGTWGGEKARPGPFPRGPHLWWGGRAGPCWPTGGCCRWFVTSVQHRAPFLAPPRPSRGRFPKGSCPAPVSHPRLAPGARLDGEPSLGVSPAWG